MIRLYVESELRLDAPVYQLFPLLEELEKSESPVHEAYKQVSMLSDCDLALIPMSIPFLVQHGRKKAVWSFIRSCEAENIPVLVFTGGDYGMSLPFSNVITVRLGGLKSKLNENTFIMPPFISDPYAILGSKPTSLERKTLPSVGFVGHSNNSFGKYLKEYVSFCKGKINRWTGKDPTDSQFFYPSSGRRHKYLAMLELDSNIDTNFIHRKKYRAGVNSEIDRTDTQREFYENMESNLYTFCMRGTGNFSARLYETLAMGRIPLMVDTDCLMPFEEQINWSDHIVRVSEEHVAHLGSELCEFHDKLSDKQCREIQLANRSLWQKFFQKDSFFLNLHNDLQSKLQI